jgi:Lamin Tail Domain
MIRKASLAAAVALSAATAVSVASPAEASSAIKVIKVYYDSPGSDTRTNTSINGEYVVLKNMTTSARSLSRWTVRDNSSHVYTFGSFTLGAGKTVTLRTGKGTNTSTTRYWGSTSYIWNNDTDRATLKNSAGTAISYCAYNSTAVDYKIC